jgi:hypothetical protein
MKITRYLVPTSRWGRWRMAVLFVVLLVVIYTHQNRFLLLVSRTPAIYEYLLYFPREGDVVFQSLPHADLVDAIEGITHSPYSHCGVVLRDEGRWVVIESIGNVHETPLFSWILRGRGGSFAAYRLDTKYAPQVASFKKALLVYSGYPYDFDYNMDHPDGVYCSDLVFLAFQKATGEKMGKLQRLGDLDWRAYRSFIAGQTNGQLPLDRVLISPASLAQAPQLHRVF